MIITIICLSISSLISKRPKNFICFNNEGVNSYKILAGYHQYFAVRKAIERTRIAVDGDGKIGSTGYELGRELSGHGIKNVFVVEGGADALRAQ